MKIRILIFSLFLLFLNVTISGQERMDTNKVIKYKHALGVGNGFTIGHGLAYRFLPNKIGFLTTFAPLYNESKTTISFGLSFLYKLIETEKTSLFIYQGNQFTHESYKYISYSHQKKVNTFNNGLGIGVEVIILKRISFNLMGGYSAYENFQRIGFTGEAGLFYKF